VFKHIIFILSMMLSLHTYSQDIDPTKPLSNISKIDQNEHKQGLNLETIIYRNKNKSAIISGKLMKVGDYIGDHELIAVNASHVVLRSDGERIKLSMFSNVVAK